LIRISSSFTSIFSKAGERTHAPVGLEAIQALGEETTMKVSQSSLVARSTGSAGGLAAGVLYKES
jgi:hypothetical protein